MRREEELSQWLQSQVDVANFEGKGIQDDEIDTLVTLIRQQKPEVTSLILKNNHITDKGAIALARQLSIFRHVNYIDLQFNQIGEAGLEALFKAASPQLRLAVHGNVIPNHEKVFELERQYRKLK